jgi:rubrerythrin
MAKSFKQLSEREILALAIAQEEEDGRIYADFADGLRESYPATAAMFEEMRAEEAGHRNSLIDTYRKRAHPAPRRKRVRSAASRLADPATRHQHRPQAG